MIIWASALHRTFVGVTLEGPTAEEPVSAQAPEIQSLGFASPGVPGSPPSRSLPSLQLLLWSFHPFFSRAPIGSLHLAPLSALR